MSDAEKNFQVMSSSRSDAPCSPSLTTVSSFRLTEPILVPESMDSGEAVSPSPNAFDPRHELTIVPDSPTEDHSFTDNTSVTTQSKFEETKVKAGDNDNYDDGVVSFKPSTSTLKESLSVTLEDAQQSVGLLESQHFCLYLSQSQASEALNKEDICEGTLFKGESGQKVTDITTAEGLSGCKSASTEADPPNKPSFNLQRPTEESAMLLDVADQSEGGGVSIFKRIKAGVSSPIKLKRVDEDSENPLGSKSKRKEKDIVKIGMFDSIDLQTKVDKRSISPSKSNKEPKTFEGLPIQTTNVGGGDKLGHNNDGPPDEDETLSYSFTDHIGDHLSVKRHSSCLPVPQSGSDSDFFMLSQKHMPSKATVPKKDDLTDERNNFPGFSAEFPTSTKSSTALTTTTLHSGDKTIKPLKDDEIAPQAAGVACVNENNFPTDSSKLGTQPTRSSASDKVKSKQGEDVTASSITKSQIFSEGSTLAQSTSLDPYAFKDSQSQSLDVAPMPLSDKPYTSVRAKRAANIKVMRKILRKKHSHHEEDPKSSSSDVHEMTKPKSCQRRKANKQDERDINTETLHHDTDMVVDGLTNISQTQFNRPRNIPPTRQHSENVAKKRFSGGNDEQKLQKKASTVSFSTDVAQTACSDGSEIMRTRVREINSIELTVTKEVVEEILNSKGEVISQSKSSEELRKFMFEPLVCKTEVTEKIVPSGMIISPSRTTSTVTTGDLADISSSSLSRTFSSGSKTSLEILPSSQPLPLVCQSEIAAPREASNIMQADIPTCVGVSAVTNIISTTSVADTGQGKCDSKRSSTSSNTGHDLFSTPNQSYINPIDSQLGKVLSSSSSFTPDQHPINVPFNQTSTTSISGTPTVISHCISVESNTNKMTGIVNENSNAACPKTSTLLTGKTVKNMDRQFIPKEDGIEVTDIQSTGFSVHGVMGSVTSGGSSRPDSVLGVSLKPSSSTSTQISLQGKISKVEPTPFILNNYKSRPDIGAKVMGRWNDAFYYPGEICKIDPTKRGQVQFDDGSQRWCRPHEIILASDIPVGQSVMVLSEDEEGVYLPGMVMAHFQGQDDNQILYQVERDDGKSQSCHRSSLILSEDQAKCLLSDDELKFSTDVTIPSATKPGEISLDNLVEGKRQTKVAASPCAKSSAVESARKRKIGPVATSTPTRKHARRMNKEDDPSTSNKKNKSNNMGSIVSSPVQARRSPRKAKIDLFASRCPRNPDLFKDMIFMLTHAEKTTQWREYEKNLLQYSSLDTSADDNTDQEVETPPFDKEQLKALIIQGGGVIVESFDSALLSSSMQCFLVAAEHQRTVKYMQALAAGVKIISHQWVLVSLEENKLQGLEAYTLPLGVSYEKKKLMEGSLLPHRARGCPELSKQSIMLVSSNQDFVDAWSSVLHLADCHVLTKFPTRATKTDPGVDVVLSDASCPTSVVRRCSQLDVALVSSEWLAQCLINGNLMDVKAHPKYRHDFMEILNTEAASP